MARVLRQVGLPFLVILPLAASCAGPEKQWYKPGGNYTVAEFERDRRACTKDRVLDEQCLQQRGWIGLSPDPDRPIAPPVHPRGY